jgi:23S rRNA (guanine2445-N2)-methyltransferase / 23S rRNA (guanine2069-N7)-methyltransferase
MAATFDVQRDHIHVMQHLKRILRQDGVIIFSNNKRQFKMDMEGMAALQLSAENISSQTLPLDFKRHQQIHNCWLIRHREADTE